MKYYYSIYIPCTTDITFATKQEPLGTNQCLSLPMIINLFNQFDITNQVYNDTILMLEQFHDSIMDVEIYDMTNSDKITIKDAILTCFNIISQYIILINEYNERCIFVEFIDDIQKIST